MALGISGSNGGVAGNYRSSCLENCLFGVLYPMEVSYFVNTECNLNCRHCYVGYTDVSDSLMLNEWKCTFNELVKMGARTFGNVGKEPLLDWDKTKELLEYFKYRKSEIPDLRFGFVTNGTLLDEQKIISLDEIGPDYIDISLDGDEEVHDWIRGKGVYEQLMANLKTLSRYSLRDRVFISFTLNRVNASLIKEVVDSIYKLGIKKLLISPYVTLNKNDMLYISDEEIIQIAENILNGSVIDFSGYEGLNIYIKNDFTTTRDVMEKMVDKAIIKKDELLIDDYGVIFNKYMFGSNVVYFNYMPFDNSYINAIRISHDGYVSNCLDMFYENYPERAIGNIKNTSINEILELAKTRLCV